jgi:HK97 family phage portal protein
MSFLDKLRRAPAQLNLEQRANPLENPSIGFNALFSYLNDSRGTDAGELVSEHNALETVTVLACVRVIAESVSSLPLKLYERSGNGRSEALDNPLYRLLAHEPNAEQSAFTFYETLTGCLALTGNCYAQIQRNIAGQPIALWPLDPRVTTPVRLPSGALAFETRDGETNGKVRIIAAADMLHVPLFSFNGLKGLSPVHLARQSIGAERAAQKFGARFFGNGARPGGILSTKSTSIDPKALVGMRESFESSNGGSNQGRLAVLPGDWTYSAIGVSPEDSQFLETLQYGRSQIAALFRVPPHMVGDTSRLSNANHEQMSLSFVTDTLRPYLTRIESEFSRKLLGADAPAKLQLVFDVSERLRTDFETTQKGYQTGVLSGWLSRNDVRRGLGENPGPAHLDTYLVPVNMQASERILTTESLQDQPISDATTESDQTPPEPKKQDTPPTDDERSILAQFAPAYIHLFADAVTRTLKRDRRDTATLKTLFEPVLRSIFDASILSAEQRFKTTSEKWTPTEKIISDALKSLEARAASWNEDSASTELTKVVRSIHTAVFRDAAACIAIEETEKSHEQKQ